MVLPLITSLPNIGIGFNIFSITLANTSHYSSQYETFNPAFKMPGRRRQKHDRHADKGTDCAGAIETKDTINKIRLALGNLEVVLISVE